MCSMSMICVRHRNIVDMDDILNLLYLNMLCPTEHDNSYIMAYILSFVFSISRKQILLVYEIKKWLNLTIILFHYC